eukprot:TRINITY_DN1247_c4_g1_i1.p1 TRINITY_DN1247_c4_g1~~TRINITY_DN1247_c4_g1_i1.p1  ORF type:complete len:1289 (+),score=299.83 TRINITY_DN1247_c4_g1_i1:88-3954(+)
MVQLSGRILLQILPLCACLFLADAARMVENQHVIDVGASKGKADPQEEEEVLKNSGDLPPGLVHSADTHDSVNVTCAMLSSTNQTDFANEKDCQCFELFAALVEECQKNTSRTVIPPPWKSCEEGALSTWRDAGRQFTSEQLDWVFDVYLQSGDSQNHTALPVYWVGFSHFLGTRAVMDDLIPYLPGCSDDRCADIERKDTPIGKIMRRGKWYRGCHIGKHDSRLWARLSAAFSARQQKNLDSLNASMELLEMPIHDLAEFKGQVSALQKQVLNALQELQAAQENSENAKKQMEDLEKNYKHEKAKERKQLTEFKANLSKLATEKRKLKRRKDQAQKKQAQEDKKRQTINSKLKEEQSMKTELEKENEKQMLVKKGLDSLESELESEKEAIEAEKSKLESDVKAYKKQVDSLKKTVQEFENALQEVVFNAERKRIEAEAEKSQQQAASERMLQKEQEQLEREQLENDKKEKDAQWWTKWTKRTMWVAAGGALLYGGVCVYGGYTIYSAALAAETAAATAEAAVAADAAAYAATWTGYLSGLVYQSSPAVSALGTFHASTVAAWESAVATAGVFGGSGAAVSAIAFSAEKKLNQFHLAAKEGRNRRDQEAQDAYDLRVKGILDERNEEILSIEKKYNLTEQRIEKQRNDLEKGRINTEEHLRNVNKTLNTNSEQFDDVRKQLSDATAKIQNTKNEISEQDAKIRNTNQMLKNQEDKVLTAQKKLEDQVAKLENMSSKVQELNEEMNQRRVELRQKARSYKEARKEFDKKKDEFEKGTSNAKKHVEEAQKAIEEEFEEVKKAHEQARVVRILVNKPLQRLASAFLVVHEMPLLWQASPPPIVHLWDFKNNCSKELVELLQPPSLRSTTTTTTDGFPALPSSYTTKTSTTLTSTTLSKSFEEMHRLNITCHSLNHALNNSNNDDDNSNYSSNSSSNTALVQIVGEEEKSSNSNKGSNYDPTTTTTTTTTCSYEKLYSFAEDIAILEECRNGSRGFRFEPQEESGRLGRYLDYTFEDCQLQCNWCSICKHFTFWPNKTCDLQGRGRLWLIKEKAVPEVRTGRRLCGQEMRNSSSYAGKVQNMKPWNTSECVCRPPKFSDIATGKCKRRVAFAWSGTRSQNHGDVGSLMEAESDDEVPTEKCCCRKGPCSGGGADYRLYVASKGVCCGLQRTATCDEKEALDSEMAYCAANYDLLAEEPFQVSETSIQLLSEAIGEAALQGYGDDLLNGRFALRRPFFHGVKEAHRQHEAGLVAMSNDIAGEAAENSEDMDENDSDDEFSAGLTWATARLKEM